MLWTSTKSDLVELHVRLGADPFIFRERPHTWSPWALASKAGTSDDVLLGVGCCAGCEIHFNVESFPLSVMPANEDACSWW